MNSDYIRKIDITAEFVLEQNRYEIARGIRIFIQSSNDVINIIFVCDDRQSLLDKLKPNFMKLPDGFLNILPNIVDHIFKFSTDPNMLIFSDESWEEFKHSIYLMNFELMLDSYDLRSKLSLDESIMILQEHFIIAPIMKS